MAVARVGRPRGYCGLPLVAHAHHIVFQVAHSQVAHSESGSSGHSGGLSRGRGPRPGSGLSGGQGSTKGLGSGAGRPDGSSNGSSSGRVAIISPCWASCDPHTCAGPFVKLRNQVPLEELTLLGRHRSPRGRFSLCGDAALVRPHGLHRHQFKLTRKLFEE